MAKEENVPQIRENLFNLISRDKATSHEMSKEESDKLREFLDEDANYLGEQRNGGDIFVVKVAPAAQPENQLTVVVVIGKCITVYSLSNLTPEIKKLYSKSFYSANKKRA